METPNSHLTLTRPDIWESGLALANRLTGYDYAPKLPLPDGTIYACGGGNYSYYPPIAPPKPKSDEEIRQEKIQEIDQRIEQIDWSIRDIDSSLKNLTDQRKKLEIEKAELEKQKRRLLASPIVFVPEGAMEWLLHEAGHWVAASIAERSLPNYGYDLLFPAVSDCGDEREWQAWAFEEIILAPFGPARSFASPTWRDGVGFSKAGPLPQAALAHIQRQILDCPIDIQVWREVWGDWVRWGNGLGVEAPWIQ